METHFSAITSVLSSYLDGVHNSDTVKLSAVFRPEARYVCATDGALLQLDMGDYVIDEPEREYRKRISGAT